MPDDQKQIRSLIKRYEMQARKQIKALQSRANGREQPLVLHHAAS